MTRKWQDLPLYGEERAACREAAALARIFRDIAVSRASAKNQSKAGGQNSGYVRYVALMKEYGNEALDLAKIIRNEESGIKQLDLATEIEERWPRANKKLHPTMLPKLISKWERDRLLPKRTLSKK